MDELDQLLQELGQEASQKELPRDVDSKPIDPTAQQKTLKPIVVKTTTPDATIAPVRKRRSIDPPLDTSAMTFNQTQPQQQAQIEGRAHRDLESAITNLIGSQQSPSPTPRQYQRDMGQKQATQTSPSMQGGPRSGPPFRICNECVMPIKEGQPIQALGKYYHADHFVCCNCHKLLHPDSFFERDHEPWCEKCVGNVALLPSCAYCNESIKGKCIDALNKKWHPEHFFCSQCGNLFPPGQSFLEKDGKAYCEEDYFTMFAPKCAACELSITSEVITALGQSYHQECFVCSEADCDVSLLETGSFYDYNGKPYCERHYHLAKGSLCATCQQPIVGRCLTALGKKFHLDHFTCTHCKKVLSPAAHSGSLTFKEKDSWPYCVPCHIKLFG